MGTQRDNDDFLCALKNKEVFSQSYCRIGWQTMLHLFVHIHTMFAKYINFQMLSLEANKMSQDWSQNTYL